MGKSFQNYFTAAELKAKSRDTQVAILLNCAGEKARDIFDAFGIEVDNEATTCKVVLDRFKTYCNPKRRPAFESYKFWKCQQAIGEPFDKWLTELRILASNCDFGAAADRQLRDKILFGTSDDTARQQMSEDKAMNICRTMEATKAQMQIMPTDAKKSSEEVMVNQININSEAAAYSSHRYSSSCQYCGLVHKPRSCPAYGKSCRKCGKRNHFATVCRSTQPSRPSTSRNIHEIAPESQLEQTFMQVHSLLRKHTEKSKIPTPIPISALSSWIQVQKQMFFIVMSTRV